MTSPDGATQLADEITRQRQADAQQFFTQAVVLEGSTTALARISIAGVAQSWAYLGSYVPRVGDVVLLGGSPGSWVVLGATSGAGAGRFTRVDSDGDVVSGTAVRGQDVAATRDVTAGRNASVTNDLAVGNNVSAKRAFLERADAPAPGGFFGNCQGTHYGDCTAGTTYQTVASDERLKENIEPRGPGALAGIDDLEVVRFDWREDTPAAGRGRQTGFIAQRLPERFVTEAPDDDGTLGVEPLGLLAEAVAAIQELRAEVTTLRAELTELRDPS